jgi:hypothetical protein
VRVYPFLHRYLSRRDTRDKTRHQREEREKRMVICVTQKLVVKIYITLNEVEAKEKSKERERKAKDVAKRLRVLPAEFDNTKDNPKRVTVQYMYDTSPIVMLVQ